MGIREPNQEPFVPKKSAWVHERREMTAPTTQHIPVHILLNIYDPQGTDITFSEEEDEYIIYNREEEREMVSAKDIEITTMPTFFDFQERSQRLVDIDTIDYLFSEYHFFLSKDLAAFPSNRKKAQLITHTGQYLQFIVDTELDLPPTTLIFLARNALSLSEQLLDKYAAKDRQEEITRLLEQQSGLYRLYGEIKKDETIIREGFSSLKQIKKKNWSTSLNLEALLYQSLAKITMHEQEQHYQQSLALFEKAIKRSNIPDTEIIINYIETINAYAKHAAYEQRTSIEERGRKTIRTIIRNNHQNNYLEEYINDIGQNDLEDEEDS